MSPAADAGTRTIFVVSRLIEFVPLGSKPDDLSKMLGQLGAMLRADRARNAAGWEGRHASVASGVQSEVDLSKPPDGLAESALCWRTPRRTCKVTEQPFEGGGYYPNGYNSFQALHEDEQFVEEAPCVVPAKAQRALARRRSIGTCCRPTRRSRATQTRAGFCCETDVGKRRIPGNGGEP